MMFTAFFGAAVPLSLSIGFQVGSHVQISRDDDAILKYSPEDKLLRSYGQRRLVHKIARAPDGLIDAVDRRNNRVQEYELLSLVVRGQEARQ